MVSPTPAFPFVSVEPLAPAQQRWLRTRLIFDAGRYDPRVGDHESVSPCPLVITPDAWRFLAQAAEELARETLAAERELLGRPDLHRRLGLARPLRAALAAGARSAGASHDPLQPDARFMRFDFHFTTQGWRISEVNSDVPGGFIEASALAHLAARFYDGIRLPPCPARALAEALVEAVGRRNPPTPSGPRPRIAMTHATAFVDDHQVMAYLARALRDRGLDPFLTAPDQIPWPQAGAGAPGLAAVVRFFPGEWLPNLAHPRLWRPFFTTLAAGTSPILCNPASALLTQSKCFPLVWSELDSTLTAWRNLLPRTLPARRVHVLRPSDPSIVLKPAWGRVGADIILRGTAPPTRQAWASVRRSVLLAPGQWVAQDRFEIVPIDTPWGPRHPCLGVFVVAGRAAGIYGRVAASPLIDHLAQDAPVFIADTPPARCAGLPSPSAAFAAPPHAVPVARSFARVDHT